MTVTDEVRRSHGNYCAKRIQDTPHGVLIRPAWRHWARRRSQQAVPQGHQIFPSRPIADARQAYFAAAKRIDLVSALTSVRRLGDHPG